MLNMKVIFAVIVALMIGAAYSQSAQKDIPPVTGKTEAGDKKDKPADGKQEISVNLPTSINVNMGGKLDIKSQSEQASANEEASKWRDPITWLTLILAGANIALWWTTRDLVREAKTASGIAKTAADSAKESSDVSHKSAMPIVFPYVSDMTGLHPLNIVESVPPEPFPCRLLIRLDNSGKTPGIIKQFRAKLFLTERDGLPDEDVKKFPRHGHPAIVPSVVSGVTGDVDLIQPFTFTPQQLRELHSRATPGTLYRRFALKGMVIYDDLFGKRHTCYFCIKLRYWKEGNTIGIFQMSLGTKYNRFTQEQIPDPDPLEHEPEETPS